MSANAPTGPAASRGSGSQDKVSNVKEKVKETTQQAASIAKEQASNVYDKQKGRALGEISNLASALRQTTNNLRQSDESSIAAQLTDRVAERLETVGRSVEGKDFDTLIRDAQDFGRRNPAAFLGIAAAIGFIAARFAKSSTQPKWDNSWQAGSEQGDVARRNPTVGYAEEV